MFSASRLTTDRFLPGPSRGEPFQENHDVVGRLDTQRELPREDYRGAGNDQFGQLAICGHANIESWALAPNDRTIRIRLQQRPSQSSASGTSAVARLSKLARLARVRKSACLLEGRGV